MEEVIKTTKNLLVTATQGQWSRYEFDGWVYIGGEDIDYVEYDPVNEPYNYEVQNAICCIGRVDDMTDRDEANIALIVSLSKMFKAQEEALQEK